MAAKGRKSSTKGAVRDGGGGDSYDRNDPYRWAGKVDIDSGPVPLSRFRGNVVAVQEGGPTQARVSDLSPANQQLRPEVRPQKNRGDKNLVYKP